MADDKTNRGPQDRTRINLSEPYEVAYWSKKFGVSSAKLRAAVKMVGDQSKAVKAQLTSSNTKATNTSKASVKVGRKAASSGRSPDAIALLRADHKRVSDLFDQFEKTRSAARKKGLVQQICLELTVHAQIEEEIFYPAVKAALKDKELVPEATVEHASVKELIGQVRDVDPDGEMYDARVKVMSEFVKHHVKEEQNEMFPRAKRTRLDMADLGARLSARKEELMALGSTTLKAKKGLAAVASGMSKRVGELVEGASG